LPVVSRYCNICNRLITSREIESGEAIVYQTYYYCPKCKQEAMPIIDAIRRRQEKEQEEQEEEKSESRKSSTRFGMSPRHKAPAKGHKLRKTRSGIFESHKSARPLHAKHSHRKPAIDQEARADKSSQRPPAADSDKIEVVDDPFDQGEAALEGMSFEDVVSSAERPGAGTGAEEQLAASGITFEDVGPEPLIATGDAPMPAVEAEGNAVEPQMLEIVPSSGDEVQAVVFDDGDAKEPAPKAQRKSASKIRKAPSKITRNIHPGKRHTHLQLPKKKTPWLAIVVIILAALFGTGLIVYKQLYMKTEKKPSVVKKEEDEKKKLEKQEQDIAGLAEEARQIAENPGNFKSLMKKARDLRMISMSKELRDKLTAVEKSAQEKYSSAARMAYTDVSSSYDKAISDGDLESAFKALESFPDYFEDTEHAHEISKMKRPVEATIALLEQFREKKAQAAEKESLGLFDEAAKIIEEISYEPEDVLPEFLKDIGGEAGRLKELAVQAKERREAKERKIKEAFENARDLVGELIAGENFQEAIDAVKKYRSEFPRSKYDGEILQLTEKIIDLKRRAQIRNFFNGADLTGWSMEGGWEVAGSEITGIASGGRMWLLKGDPSWSDFTFEFDFKRLKGSLVLCLRANPGEPESGFTLNFKERPFQADAWYHVKCEAAGDNIFITTSFNGQKFVFNAGRGSGLVGFLLPEGSTVVIRKVTMELP